MGQARPRKGRPINGVLLLDKPKEMTSNRAIQVIKRLYEAQKVGHTGALDPLATGLLPVCLGEATKFSQYLLDADKAYRVEAQLGVRTTTSDAEGEVVEQNPVDVSDTQLNDIIAQFTGEQAQTPSIYSALKYEGKPLYYYARRGIDVPRKTRTISVRAIELLHRDGDFVTLQVACSKGTYIRTLVDDMGQALGCGAHVRELRRTHVANLTDAQQWSLEALEQCDDEQRLACLEPVDTLLNELPTQTISQAEARDVMHGQPVFNRTLDTQAVGDECRLCAKSTSGHSVFIGVVVLRKDGKLWPKRVLALDYCGFNLSDLK
ncbi:tRNA pseudouridine(55) synthase TruB [Idiomarina sp.]|uniref:tRNA pseudouridine(55) synthase TruB n=1 Tax=Idiomarina sp. TaxID=1874361 RepID=UPI00258E72EA|nr:tRNA pseudouridine(55) synthase TruB [Idiomarina sp.]